MLVRLIIGLNQKTQLQEKKKKKKMGTSVSRHEEVHNGPLVLSLPEQHENMLGLNLDVFDAILCRVSFSDLARCACVCQSWRKGLLQSKTIWNQQCQRLLRENLPHTQHQQWSSFFFTLQNAKSLIQPLQDTVAEDLKYLFRKEKPRMLLLSNLTRVEVTVFFLGGKEEEIFFPESFDRESVYSGFWDAKVKVVVDDEVLDLDTQAVVLVLDPLEENSLKNIETALSRRCPNAKSVVLYVTQTRSLCRTELVEWCKKNKVLLYLHKIHQPKDALDGLLALEDLRTKNQGNGL